MLRPESQKRLALSTHRGVLLQLQLPFGISSAPTHFQVIMDQLISDLKGVAVNIDDILVSEVSAAEHLENHHALLQRLQDKGLRCRQQKCMFAQSSIEYLGYTLSSNGIAKGSKVDAIQLMPAPADVSSLRSFLGSVQFYGNLATVTELLYHFTKKDVKWRWGPSEQAAFTKLKEMLTADMVLAHFDPSLPVGISCDASETGLGAVLFHRYPDGSEHPVANVSKTLSDTIARFRRRHWL